MGTTIFKDATILVTGASSGIGEAFARQLAKRGAHLILTARSQQKLEQLADELRAHHQISVQVFPKDLSLMQAPQELFQEIQASGLVVDVLINNAGFGKWAHFLGEQLDTYEQMVALNVKALMRLSYLCIPSMLARGKGGVINVASTAAFQPGPYFAVYAASKAFVLHFTEALAGKYRGRGLNILTLCPGATATNFNAVAHIPDVPHSSADEVVEAGLKAYAQHKSTFVHGCRNYLTSLLPRILPRAMVIGIVVKMFKNKVRPWPVGEERRAHPE